MINIDQNLDENQMKFERNSGGMIRIKWNVIEEYAGPYKNSADVQGLDVPWFERENSKC